MDATGRLMPVEAVPTPRTGTLAARRLGDRYVAGYMVSHRAPLRPGFTLFTPHWTTCDGKPSARTPRTTPLF